VFYRVNPKREGQVSIRGKYRKTVDEPEFFDYDLGKQEVEIKFEFDGTKYSLIGHRPDRRKLARVGEILTAKQWSIYPVVDGYNEVPGAISVEFGDR